MSYLHHFPELGGHLGLGLSAEEGKLPPQGRRIWGKDFFADTKQGNLLYVILPALTKASETRRAAMNNLILIVLEGLCSLSESSFSGRLSTLGLGAPTK